MQYLIHLYCLLLEDGYYYVGRSKDLEKRLKQHFKGNGAAWTRLHAPIEVISEETFLVSTKEEEDRWENFMTIKLMKEKGWRNVRGGFWCNVREIETLKNLNAHGYFIDVDINDIEFEARTAYAYILRLEEEKFFVGYTWALKNAVESHGKGKASQWTNMYPPIEIVEYKELVFEDGIVDISAIDEIVLEFGKTCGYENIRGGRFIFMDEERHLHYIYSLLLKHGKVNKNDLPRGSVKYSKLLTEYENTYGLLDLNMETKEGESIFMIYILELEGGYYHISSTKDLNALLLKYEKGKCGAWCKKHPIISLQQVIPVIGTKDFLEVDNQDPIVEYFFDKYGAKYIRGGRFSIVNEESHLKNVAEKYEVVDGKHLLKTGFEYIGSVDLEGAWID